MYRISYSFIRAKEIKWLLCGADVITNEWDLSDRVSVSAYSTELAESRQDNCTAEGCLLRRNTLYTHIHLLLDSSCTVTLPRCVMLCDAGWCLMMRSNVMCCVFGSGIRTRHHFGITLEHLYYCCLHLLHTHIHILCWWNIQQISEQADEMRSLNQRK